MRASWRSGAVAKDLDCTSDQLNAAAGAGNSKIEAKTRIGNRDLSFKMFERFRIFDLFTIFSKGETAVPNVLQSYLLRY